MKKHLLWITPVTLGVGYFLFQPESISLETPMNTQDVLIADKPTAHKEEPPEKKPKFELVPLPTQKPEQSACWDVQDKQRDIYLRAPKRILVPTAWRLYAQGHDKQEIAKAMTARSQQLEFAADWLRTVIVSEDVITHQHALKAYIFRAFDMDNKPTSNNLSDKRVDMYTTGEDILKSIDEIVTQYSTEQQVSTSPPQLGQMWSEVNFSGVEAALADRATGADIMYAIDEALKNIPEELLNSSISPINRLFVALLRSQHADTALALARRYPKAVYEQSGVLAFSTYEVLSFVARHRDLTQNSEQISELVALSGLSDRNWASQKLFHGDVPQTAARKLKEIGIHISIDDLEALLDADEELVAEFGELPTLSEQDKAMLEACDGNQSWLNKRTKTPEQWLSYQQDEFTQRVVKSPEFAECTSSTTHSKSQGTISALNRNTMTWLREHVSADKIKRADLGGADVSALSNREKSFIALAMGTHASKNDQVTQEQIITLLENQGIRFDIHDSELVAHFAGFTALTPWLEHADNFSPQVARELANVFARRGIAEQYEAIQKYLEPSDSELDPLYYLIQGFTPLRMSMGDGTSLHSGNYVAIAQRIKEQGYEVKEHHRRALFERSVEKASAANSLMSLFPELTPVSDDEYFAVKCEEQVQIELL